MKHKTNLSRQQRQYYHEFLCEVKSQRNDISKVITIECHQLLDKLCEDRMLRDSTNIQAG